MEIEDTPGAATKLEGCTMVGSLDSEAIRRELELRVETRTGCEPFWEGKPEVE